MVENHLTSEQMRVEGSVRSQLKSLNEVVKVHEANKTRLQDKLANPQLSDASCLDQYRNLVKETEAMINHLYKEISKLIELL